MPANNGTKLVPPVGPRDHVQGPEDARVTLVEYGDFECPHCRAAHPVVRRIQERFGASVRFVFRNFPLTEIHPLAEPAAEAAEFAATQGKFWEMHDSIFEHQAQLSLQFLAGLDLVLEQVGFAVADHFADGGVGDADFAGQDHAFAISAGQNILGDDGLE